MKTAPGGWDAKLLAGYKLATFLTVIKPVGEDPYLYITDHPSSVTTEPFKTYTPYAGMLRSAISITDDMDVANLDFQFLSNPGDQNPLTDAPLQYYSNSPITMHDALAGAYRGSRFIYEIGFPDFPDVGLLTMMAGTFGETQIGRSVFKVVGESDIIKLHVANPQNTSPVCRNRMGNTRCGIDLPSISVTRTITAILNGGSVLEFNSVIPANPTVVAGFPSSATMQTFGLGTITFLDGANAGSTCDCNGFYVNRLMLQVWIPPTFTPTIGDSVSIAPGCDYSLLTCQAYKNVINMQAEPFLPAATTQNDVLSFTS